MRECDSQTIGFRRPCLHGVKIESFRVESVVVVVVFVVVVLFLLCLLLTLPRFPPFHPITHPGTPPSSPFRCPSVSSFSSFRSASSSASDAGFVLPPSPDLHFDVRPSPRPTPNRSSPSVGDDNAHKSRRVLASRQAEAAANYDPKIGDQLFVKKELEEIDIKKTKTGGGRTEGTEMVRFVQTCALSTSFPAHK